MSRGKHKNYLIRGTLFLMASLLVAAVAEGAGISSDNAHWSLDLTPPRRPADLGQPQQSTAPLPPSRPVNLTPSVPTSGSAAAPLPPTRPAGLSAPKSGVAAPASAMLPKAPAAPVAKAAPATTADNSCGPGQAKKQEVLRKYDQAIAEIEGQLASVETSAQGVQQSLKQLLSDSNCFKEKFLGGSVYSMVQQGLGPDESGKTAGQRAMEIPEKTRKGFRSQEGNFVGLDKLLADLRQAKANYQKMDFCRIDACNGAFRSLNDLDGSLAQSVAEARKTTAAVLKGIDEADRKITEDKISQLSSAASAYSCPNVGASAQGALSSWKRVKSAFAGLAQDMARRAGLMGKQVASLAKVQGSCSAVAGNP